MSIPCLQLVNSKADSYFSDRVWFNPEDSIESRLLSLVRNYGDNAVLHALKQIVPPETEFLALETESDTQAFLQRCRTSL